MNIENQDVVFIDMWYDKYTRLWVIQKKDKNGNQIGEAFYGVKMCAEIEYKRLLEKYKL